MTVPGVDALVDFIARHPRLVVLTGAGCSTDSGIPDYRDEAGAWKRAQPVTYQDFVGKPHTRQRYWARSIVGFRKMRGARPNDAHRALVELEAQGRVEQLVTQNVDGLHQAAGSRDVVDLHGRIDVVRCLECQARVARDAFQAALTARNPTFATLDALGAPDGDADLDGIDFGRFDIPPCDACGGLMKPDVVFFGEGVPPDRVQRVFDAVAAADAMLVVGSSLMVYSGFRFVKAMVESGKPVAAVNRGRTRADDLLSLKVEGNCADVLRAAVAERGRSAAPWRLDDQHLAQRGGRRTDLP